MGGRGGSGGGPGRSTNGAWTAPSMAGSADEVSRAKKLIEDPYRSLGEQAETARKNAEWYKENGNEFWYNEKKKEESAYQAAQTRYAQLIDDRAGQLKNPWKASSVIKNRHFWQGAARAIAENELKKRK